MPAPAIQPLHHASQLHIDAATPMGANVVEDDATFRAWARGAVDVYVITSDLPLSRNSGWTPRKRTGCFAGMTERGRVSSQAWWTARLIVFTRGCRQFGIQKGSFARELGTDPPFPDCDCLVRASDTYPWHDSAFRPAPFHELIIYQLHVGAFYGVDAQGHDKRERVAKFLDVILFNYGRCLYRMERKGEARKQFDQLIADFPESPLAADAKKIAEALSQKGF